MPTFRTDDGTRWGAGKGSNLTPTEVDLNFWDLDQRVAAVEENPIEPNEIASITSTGSQMTVHMADGSTHGPFTLPRAIIRFRGDWAPATAYLELDLVQVVDEGLYLVLRDHTSDATFDPLADDGSGNLLYRWLLPTVAGSFTGLSDTPGTYGTAGYLVAINGAGDGLEFIEPGSVSGSVAWTNITDKPSTFAPSAHTHASANITDFAEGVDDRVAALVTAGSNVTVTYDDGAGTLTIAASGTITGTVAWVNVTDKPTEFTPETHQHVVADITDFAEGVDDRVAALLVAGAGISLTYDDGAGTLTVAATGHPGTVSTKTAGHTFGLADAGTFVDYNSASAGVFTIPADATTDFPVGTIIAGGQIGAGALTITAAGGVVLNGVTAGSATLTDAQSEYSIRKRAANSWRITGKHGVVA